MILKYRIHKNTLFSKNSIKYSLLTWYNEGGELDSQLCSIPDLRDSLCGPQNSPPTKWLICCLTTVSLQGQGRPAYIRQHQCILYISRFHLHPDISAWSYMSLLFSREFIASVISVTDSETLIDVGGSPVYVLLSLVN